MWVNAGQISFEQLSQCSCEMQTSLYSHSAEISIYAKIIVNQMRRNPTRSTGISSAEPRSHLAVVVTVVCGKSLPRVRAERWAVMLGLG